MRVRVGKWLALMGLALGLPTPACSGDYPLPPTRCDEYCDATKGGYCQDYYLPASCVADCENNDTNVEACRALFDATVSCFRASPRALEQRCAYDNLADDCDNEYSLLLNCVSNESGSSTH